MIVKNRLLNFDNKIIYQDNDCFLFSLDSVLLANFVTLKLTDKLIMDLCSGNAPVPMLLSFRTNARIFGVEIQKKIYDLGVMSIKENNLEEQISFFNDDVKNICNLFNENMFDVITCNPPYFKYNSDSLINFNKEKAIARHEILVNLEEIISNSSYMLKNGGTLALVHKADRLMEIVTLMRKYGIEPKKLRIVYPKSSKNGDIVLIEGSKNGNVGLKIMPPLITHLDNGQYCDEIREMFGGFNNVAK